MSEERGAICKDCGQHMFEAEGCNSAYALLAVKRIKYGDEYRHVDPEQNKLHGYDKPCHDCGAKIGHYHHAGCDEEKCPICGFQIITCDGHHFVGVMTEEEVEGEEE